MMAEPSVTTLITMRDALVKARLSGLTRITDQNGESVEYKSDSDMAAALASVNRLILQATLGGAAPGISTIRTMKGA
ncbi:hypothetical protein LWC05_03220 [Acetobacter sicerae]|uniref:Phage tail protein n=1 Tax=Acetobacter sicerae TaxID=85325 RepID=A0ABS8VWH5_9PROT|nr:hypothetical protein [Acetobacter sicerae]MCE0742902.1 hypothetical protein [Acetobacter sicerae]